MTATMTVLVTIRSILALFGIDSWLMARYLQLLDHSPCVKTSMLQMNRSVDEM